MVGVYLHIEEIQKNKKPYNSSTMQAINEMKYQDKNMADINQVYDNIPIVNNIDIKYVNKAEDQGKYRSIKDLYGSKMNKIKKEPVVYERGDKGNFKSSISNSRKGKIVSEDQEIDENAISNAMNILTRK